MAKRDAPTAATRQAETSQTLSRGLDVLALVCGAQDGLAPAQVATTLGLSRTIVYRLLSTLEQHRLVRRNEDGTYTAGLGTMLLGQHIAPALQRASREVLVRLAEELQATAHVTIADGDDALALAVVEPASTAFHVAYRTGSRTPIDKAALGRALLAARSGRRDVLTSEGELISGAKGVVAALPAPGGLALAVGVVTLGGTDTSAWGARVAAAADELESLLRG